MHHTLHTAEIVCGVFGLLFISAITLAITKRFKFPFTIILTLVGMTLSWLGSRYPVIFAPMADLQVSSGLIFFVFLPTLIFESSLNLDVRRLRHNLDAVLLLAGPGLLLSALIIGMLIGGLTNIPYPSAFLLGAILSATDPVAVIALFKQLGAPQRLTVMVEGESIFNDATSMVSASVLLGIIGSAEAVTGYTVAGGIVDFALLFLGGALLGWVLGLLTGMVIGKVASDPFIEITLTVVLAYFSFLLAEEVFHVSGVMAVMAAGLTVGSWGRMKISPAVRHRFEGFWEYMVAVANALIFLMMGLRLERVSLLAVGGLLLLVIFAVLISRAAVVFGLLPIGGRLIGAKPVSGSYQIILFWGGLRGAVALAIVMGLPAFHNKELFGTLVMGVVLFTLLAQGLTIRPLMHRLGLDRLPLIDRLGRVETDLAATRRASRGIRELQEGGGMFSASLASHLQSECMLMADQMQNTIAELRCNELDPDLERRYLFIRTFTEERICYAEMFSSGHLSERAFRRLDLNVDLQLDKLRYKGVFMFVQPHPLRRFRARDALTNFVDRVPGGARLAEHLREVRVAVDYEEAWGHYHASSRVLKHLKEITAVEAIPEHLVKEITAQYEHWRKQAQRRLDQVAAQYPDFYGATQNRLGKRMILLAAAKETKEQARRGTIQPGVAESMQEEITHRLAILHGQETKHLRIEPTELLRTVKLFKGMTLSEFKVLAKRLRLYTIAEGEVVLHQGESGDALYLIARGVLRVSGETEAGEVQDLATLTAGDFFGEMALLSSDPRSATVQATTPCSLYRLKRGDLEAILDEHPQMRAILQATAEKHAAGQT